MIMRNIKAVVLVMSLFFLLPLAAGQTKSQATTAARKASLDLLVSRIDSYWKLMLQGKRTSAAQYVAPADREEFAGRANPKFTDPRLKSIEFSKDRTEAIVTVTVKRALPIGVMNWPVEERWAFQNSNWYVQFELKSAAFPGGGDEPGISESAIRAELMERELREMFRLEQTVLDFGTVRQGMQVSLPLKYSLAGDESIRATTRDRPPGIVLGGLKNQRLTLLRRLHELLLELADISEIIPHTES